MDDKTKSQEQVETKNEINKEESKIKRKKVNSLFIVLAFFVLFSLIPVIGYLLFKYNVGNAFKENESCKVNRQAVCDPTREEGEDSSGTEVIDIKQNNLEVVNRGWALIFAPDIKLSVEIPSSEPVTHNFQGTQLESFWDNYYLKTNDSPYKSLGIFQAALHLSFNAIDNKNVICGGSGCLNMSSIIINGYKKPENKSLEVLVEDFKKEVDPNEDDLIIDIDGKYTSRWGFSVFEYSKEGPVGDSNGYILLKGNFIYDITYYINSQPEVAAETANKILNSIKFY